uniref:Inulinase n=1 Tax=Papiliotrema aurea TaxID=214992 RepID=I7EDT5_9TREE|nr:inulinase [Papiliotrema aurea]
MKLAYSLLLPLAGVSASVINYKRDGDSKAITNTTFSLNRPSVHFTPSHGWMNDPNGLFVDKNGTWHLYYQCEWTRLTAAANGCIDCTVTPNADCRQPDCAVAGNQHWGHATSPDLYTWTNQPIALFPPNSTSGVFSGSAVIDANNTSGFFPDQDDGVVAIYTLNTPTLQVQELALSYDGGYTFTPYEGNPVLDVGSNQFRDPKVVWYEDHWVMVIAYSTEFTIGIFTSNDLKTWEHASNFTDMGLLGLQYECPNLIQVPVWENGTATGDLAWIMLISINPGAPLGGSISEYFPGTFDGYTFTPYDGAARISDFAKDNYAEQYFFGTDPSEAISIAWASNWQYTNVVPTGDEGWRSAMSLPRYNYLTKVERTGWEMGSLPYKQLDAVKGRQFSYDQDFGNNSVTIDYSNVTSGAMYFSANITLPEGGVLDATSTLNLTFSSSAGDRLRAGYIFGGSNAGVGWIDRRYTLGYGEDDPLFTDRFSVAGVALAKRIEGVIDRSIFEMFIDDGAFSGTSVFFPQEPLNNLTVQTGGMPEGSRIEIAVWELDSAWQ